MTTEIIALQHIPGSFVEGGAICSDDPREEFGTVEIEVGADEPRRWIAVRRYDGEIVEVYRNTHGVIPV